MLDFVVLEEIGVLDDVLHIISAGRGLILPSAEELFEEFVFSEDYLSEDVVLGSLNLAEGILFDAVAIVDNDAPSD